MLIEAPVREQTVITIEPNKEQKTLRTMIRWVKEGRWGRNFSFHQGRMCALGMVMAASGEVYVVDDPFFRVVNLLDRAIDVFPRHDMNGGLHRGKHTAHHRVASYSNCARDEQQIISWFERAAALA